MADPQPAHIDGRNQLSQPRSAVRHAEPMSIAMDASELAALLRPVMKAIALTVGSQCEVVFHDLTGPGLEHSIVAIENGHVTGRSIGGPSTNLGLEVLGDQDHDHNAFGYRARTADGRDLRSSSVYFRDADGKVVGALCINMDLTKIQQAQHLIGELLPRPEAPERDETFAGDISQVLEELIEQAVQRVGKPVGVMEREDKMVVLAYLDQHGAFFVKRAMDRVAARLGMSRVTAYKYLDDVRSNPSTEGRPRPSAERRASSIAK